MPRRLQRDGCCAEAIAINKQWTVKKYINSTQRKGNTCQLSFLMDPLISPNTLLTCLLCGGRIYHKIDRSLL